MWAKIKMNKRKCDVRNKRGSIAESLVGLLNNNSSLPRQRKGTAKRLPPPEFLDDSVLGSSMLEIEIEDERV